MIYIRAEAARNVADDGIQKKMQNGLVVAAVIISIVVGACASFSTAISQDCEGLQDTFGLAKDATH